MSTARQDSFSQWASVRGVPGERLAAFERWLFAEMATRLIWPQDEVQRARMIGQCRSFVMAAVADLERHGFLFQPRELAELLREKLDQIGRLQKDGKVENVFPYFRACWQGWVRREADSLRDRSMSCGAHINQVMGRILTVSRAPEVSMASIVAQSLREQAAAARRKRSNVKPQDGQELFSQ